MQVCKTKYGKPRTDLTKCIVSPNDRFGYLINFHETLIETAIVALCASGECSDSYIRNKKARKKCNEELGLSKCLENISD